jgi:hypothetical protein
MTTSYIIVDIKVWQTHSATRSTWRWLPQPSPRRAANSSCAADAPKRSQELGSRAACGA